MHRPYSVWSLPTAAAIAFCFVLAFTPSPAGAASFVFQKSFDVAAFGATAGGTPRGLAIGPGGALYLNDALDDQVYLVDPVGESATATYETNPFVCAVGNLACTPTQDWARVAWDVAYDGSSVWLIDKESGNGTTTWLLELNANGELSNRYDASSSGADPGGLVFDPRGAGSLWVSDRGANWATNFALDGTALGLSSLKPGGIGSETPTGLAYLGGDTFLVSDAGDDTLYEFSIPQGGGTATLIGESIFPGFDLAANLPDLQSVAYDASSETLYLLDGFSDRVFVFAVPEPGTAVLLGWGLVALAARRRRP